MAQVLAPIYQILQKDKRFEWNNDCQNAFEMVKKLIASDKVLIHYDRNAPLKLVCDAAFDGIGAAIFHPSVNGTDGPITFVSRVLQPAKKSYSATDREALAIYFGVSKFSQYLLGRKFTLLTDHKPLVTIFGKKKGIPVMAACRLQRWSVFLSNFDFDIQHINGKDNVNADFLSRFTARHEKVETDVSYLNFLAGNFTEMLARKDIQRESLADPVIWFDYRNEV